VRLATAIGGNRPQVYTLLDVAVAGHRRAEVIGVDAPVIDEVVAALQPQAAFQTFELADGVRLSLAGEGSVVGIDTRDQRALIHIVCEAVVLVAAVGGVADDQQVAFGFVSLAAIDDAVHARAGTNLHGVIALAHSNIAFNPAIAAQEDRVVTAGGMNRRAAAGHDGINQQQLAALTAKNTVTIAADAALYVDCGVAFDEDAAAGAANITHACHLAAAGDEDTNAVGMNITYARQGGVAGDEDTYGVTVNIAHAHYRGVAVDVDACVVTLNIPHARQDGIAFDADAIAQSCADITCAGDIAA